ncbi:MAG: DUF3305 domain-containing protein [Rhodospirillales bacterium]
MQTSEAITVGVVAERRRLDSPWADHDWQPYAVLPDVPDLAAGSLIGAEPGRERFYLGPIELRLHRRETESYRYNLAGQPRLYIAMRQGEGPGGLPVLALLVTAAPDEAQSLAEPGDKIVDGVAMPRPIAEWIADFVRRFHVEEPKYKRQRTPAELEKFARAPGPAGKREGGKR